MNNLDLVFSKTKPFTYGKYKDLPVIAIHFPKIRVVRYQELIINLIQVVNDPLHELDETTLNNINTNILKTFEFSKSLNAKENILLFTEWMQQNFYPQSPQLMKKSIENYVQKTYGQSVLEEMLDLREYTTISQLLLRIEQRAAALKQGWKTLSKQDIFELYYLRKIYIAISRNAKEIKINTPEFLLCSETYNNEKNGFNKKERYMFFGGKKKRELSTHNYESIESTLDIIIGSVKKARTLYPSAKFLFIARDGIIFYEAHIALYPEKIHNSSLIYVSRDMLQNPSLEIEGHNLKNYMEKLPVYEYLVDEFLKSAIKKYGHSNINAIVNDIELGLKAHFAREKTGLYQKIEEFLRRNMAEYLNNVIGDSREVVFFDSSSKTFPVLLCAFMRIMYPEKRFYPFFAITPYTDAKAGYLTGHSEDYSTDFLSDIVRYNKKLSGMSPFTSTFTYSGIDCMANNFLIMIMFYNKMHQ